MALGSKLDMVQVRRGRHSVRWDGGCSASTASSSKQHAGSAVGSDRMRTGGPQHAMTYKCRLRAPAAATWAYWITFLYSPQLVSRTTGVEATFGALPQGHLWLEGPSPAADCGIRGAAAACGETCPPVRLPVAKPFRSKGKARHF
jgi:hypothetical protein